MVNEESEEDPTMDRSEVPGIITVPQDISGIEEVSGKRNSPAENWESRGEANGGIEGY